MPVAFLLLLGQECGGVGLALDIGIVAHRLRMESVSGER